MKPPSAVTDYRTQWSGIRPEDLEGDRVVTLREVLLVFVCSVGTRCGRSFDEEPNCSWTLDQ